MHVHVPLQGFIRRSNTGSLTAQAPPTVVHSSSSSFISTRPSSSIELTTPEHSVNRRGNTDPLAAQAPPTVVHNIHSLSTGKLVVKQVNSAGRPLPQALPVFKCCTRLIVTFIVRIL